MGNLFRSGTVFFVIAGISFLAAAITTAKYLMTENGSAASPGGAVANAVVMLVIGMAIRSKNARQWGDRPSDARIDRQT